MKKVKFDFIEVVSVQLSYFNMVSILLYLVE